MHDVSGKLSFMPYGINEQVVLSAGRRMLNEELMNVAEKHSNVKFHFNVSCKHVNLRETSFTMEDEQGKRENIQSNYIIGADGSFSSIRAALEHRKGINYQQTYLPHGYKELTIPANSDGDFAMEVNALHIWPRGDFMMIALPNPDRTFTVTLFLPWEGENGFNQIKTKEQLMNFFENTFPDSIPLMPNLVEEYFANPIGHIVTIKCDPWYYNNTVILGDAAHAIVPFYGQGMNASLEDVDVFDELLSACGGDADIASIFPSFFKLRKPAADAISDLSRENYIEMRAKVASNLFLLRKSIESVIHRILPGTFIPLYTMVAFTNIPYHKVIQRDKKQTKILNRIFFFTSVAFGIGIFVAVRPLNEYAFDTLSRLRLKSSI